MRHTGKENWAESFTPSYDVLMMSHDTNKCVLSLYMSTANSVLTDFVKLLMYDISSTISEFHSKILCSFPIKCTQSKVSIETCTWAGEETPPVRLIIQKFIEAASQADNLPS